ncbi:MAG: biotin/lipoyl-binding protein [Chlorobiales bacterium]|jgi:biotin carboxyl carrier protein|nr:biotin/lipoyl-binding protein [Chlorobiales bacterium]
MKYKAIINDKVNIELELTGGASDGQVALKLGQDNKDARLVPLAGNIYQFIYEGKVYLAEVAKAEGSYTVKMAGHAFDVAVIDEKMMMIEHLGIKTTEKKASGDIKSPMPGLVVKIDVAVGDTVSVGQGILVLEAMKMQNEIKSAVAGVVKEIKVSERQPVEKNQLLLKIE